MSKKRKRSRNTYNTKPASERVFYRAPRTWKVWDLFFTPAAMVLYVLTIGFTIALVNLF